MIGNQIQNYKIISLLGEGGMANVYLAQHQSLGNNVAIKLLKDEYVLNSNIRKRFLAEARNLAKMSHPNIIKVTDLIDAGDIVAFVMEYIEGQTLEDLLLKKGKLTSLEIEGLFNQMILAVEYVHEQGLIHRDIKPSNFMVTKNGQIKLLDFGIAKNTNDNAVDYTKTGLMQQMGTPMYMSPEQVRSTSEITKETDYYSLGVVLWEMVMNKKPYDSTEFSLPEIQVSILKEKLPLTNTIWDSTIQKSTEKESIKRSLKFTSINDLDYKSVSDTLIDTAISNPNKKEKERKGFFKIKNLGFGLGILLFGIILIYSFSEERITEKSILISDGKILDKKKEETSNDTIGIIKIQDTLVVIKKESKEFLKEIPKQKKDTIIENQQNHIKIGSQKWMSKNLSVTNFKDGSKLFYAKSSSDWIEATKNKIPAYTVVKVRGEKQTLYNAYVIHNVREIAPSGYHVPNVQEWIQLIEFCGGESVAGSNLTSKKFSGSDKFGFNAIPAGSFQVYHQKYNGVEEVSGGNRDYQGSSLWWTSETRNDDFDNSIRPYFVSSKDGFIWWGTHNYGYGCSIRLIKN